MRLTANEVNAIINSLEAFLPKEFKGELLLFGSRTKDHLKGGDIDLALSTDSSPHAKLLNLNLHKILASIKMQSEIGDRRIDLKIVDKNIPKSAFFTEALKGSLVINQWS